MTMPFVLPRKPCEMARIKLFPKRLINSNHYTAPLKFQFHVATRNGTFKNAS